MPIELEPVLLQNDGSNFLSWSIHVLNAFRDITPLVEHIMDASIPLPIVDWSNYKNLLKEEEICVQLNAQTINVILSTLSHYYTRTFHRHVVTHITVPFWPLQ